MIHQEIAVSYLRGTSVSVVSALACTAVSLNDNGKYSPAAHTFARSAKCRLVGDPD
jgi:hypothetical protein